MMRETWYVNYVVLVIVCLALPWPQGAAAGTPGNNNSTEPVTTVIYSSSSSVTDSIERGNMESNTETSSTSSYSSESVSPSQRNILLTRTAAAAGNVDTDQTKTFSETSSSSLESLSQSTEPLTSTLVDVTTESTTSSSISISSSREWKDLLNTNQIPVVSPSVSRDFSFSWMLTEDGTLPQDSPGTIPRLGDASVSALASMSHTDSTYTSTAVSRAGERTLLSVTSHNSGNSTSSASTGYANSHQPPSTLGISPRAAEAEDYTHSTDRRDTMDQQHMTRSTKARFSQTEGTQRLNDERPNATQHHRHNSTTENTSDSTPPLRLTETGTDQSELSSASSSTPPVTSPAEVPTDVAGTDRGSGSSIGGSYTESSTGAHSSSTRDQEGNNRVSSQTREQSTGLGLTTAPPMVSSSSTSELDRSLANIPVSVTEVFFTTTPVTISERSQMTEEDTFKATASITNTITTTTVSLPAYSFSGYSSTTSRSTPGSPTETTSNRAPYTKPSTAASTMAQHTSAAQPTHPGSPSRTQGPVTDEVNPTNVVTQQMETSTLGLTMAPSQDITTTYTQRTSTKSTEAPRTTGKPTTELLLTTPPSDFEPPPPPPLGNPCVSNPCMNGGMCVSYNGNLFTCHCQQAWTGPTCNQDMDECERDPCPIGSRCVNTRGSFSCECPLGFNLEDGRTCTRAKTFLGTFSVNRLPHDPFVFKSATMHEIQREIIQLLNASLSVLQGYSRSTLSKKGENGVRILAVNMFSVSSDVTNAEVYKSIQMSLTNCSSSLAHCRMVLLHQLTYQVESLCVAQKTQCDSERSTCTDSSGTAHCQCLQGYYKHNPDDLSCLECGDGYKLENNTCVPCMFGFGGFNCGNFYKLIAVVVSPAGGALLLILVIALIVTCCKDKNDINKIIFKSGDLQMSPYADFPKSNRISTEWGRETIEMQENGSTKNLLQMTDIYYSPALRNSDLERNGLYPFTGLPGSRHSCIYPAQWNPSFISDDSRRRDYF